MQHVIVTRFGVGQARDEFYRSKLPILKTTLLPTLDRQVRANFRVVLITDHMCPPWVRRDLSAISSDRPWVTVHYHNPFRRFRLMPNLGSVIEKKLAIDEQHWPLLMTRIDDDDGLAPHFCSAVTDFARSIWTDTKLPSSVLIAHGRGVMITTGGEVIAEVNYPEVSIQSVLTNEPGRRSPYEGSHRSSQKRYVTSDGLATNMVCDDALWFRYLRAGSEATRGGHRSNVRKYLEGFPGRTMIRQWDSAEFSEYFGLDTDFFRRLACLEAKGVQDHVDLIVGGAPRLKRMQIKRELLRVAKRISKKPGRGQKKQLKAIKEGFYQI